MDYFTAWLLAKGGDRHGPSAVSKAIPRQNQVENPIPSAIEGHRLKPATFHRTSPNMRLMQRTLTADGADEDGVEAHTWLRILALHFFATPHVGGLSDPNKQVEGIPC
jgi:hypothetical protein